MYADEKRKLETQLVRYHELLREFPEGPIADTLRDLIEELRQEIRELEKQ